jgi:hypothetical protein
VRTHCQSFVQVNPLYVPPLLASTQHGLEAIHVDTNNPNHTPDWEGAGWVACTLAGPAPGPVATKTWPPTFFLPVLTSS